MPRYAGLKCQDSIDDNATVQYLLDFSNLMYSIIPLFAYFNAYIMHAPPRSTESRNPSQPAAARRLPSLLLSGVINVAPMRLHGSYNRDVALLEAQGAGLVWRFLFTSTVVIQKQHFPSSRVVDYTITMPWFD